MKSEKPDLIINVYKRSTPIKFDRLLNGRCFWWERRPNDIFNVWIKIDKNFCQPLDDNNLRIRFPNRFAEIVEVSLVEERAPTSSA